jgi:hypothetical protein
VLGCGRGILRRRPRAGGRAGHSGRARRNTLLRPLINVINRTPIDERRTEATYEVRVTTESMSVVAARDLLIETLEAAAAR